MTIVAKSELMKFDVNGDLIVNTDDLIAWLILAGDANIGQPYPLGDANLDGTVNALDLNKMALNWLAVTNTWTGGDFTADGTVNAADLNVIALNWSSAAAATAALPEPSGFPLGLAALAMVGWLRRMHA